MKMTSRWGSQKQMGILTKSCSTNVSFWGRQTFPNAFYISIWVVLAHCDKIQNFIQKIWAYSSRAYSIRVECIPVECIPADCVERIPVKCIPLPFWLKSFVILTYVLSAAPHLCVASWIQPQASRITWIQIQEALKKEPEVKCFVPPASLISNKKCFFIVVLFRMIG